MNARLGLLCVLVVGLFAANLAIARAHNWWYYYWPRSNMQVFIGNSAVAADAARRDWASHTHLKLARSPRHTDISVFSGDYGNTGWSGLTTIEQWGLDYPWHCGGAPWCRMIHVHSRYNSYQDPDPRVVRRSTGGGQNSDVRGIFCQEIGHALGLWHSNGDCMGKGYYANVNVTGAHSWTDVNARY